MSANSKIEWCDHTFNPWWGCTRVSPACEHCYAERFAKRVGVKWGTKAERRFFGAEHWNNPDKWNSAARTAGRIDSVFCGSMCDWAEDNPALPDVRYRLWTLIRTTPHLRWLLLTKRADRIAECLPADWGAGYPNVALGVTAENQEWADKRIPELLRVPARWRFLSVEPMLGAVDVELAMCTCPWPVDACRTRHLLDCPSDTRTPDDQRRWAHLDWVICGGESGPGARPMHPDWARRLRDQCVAAGVPFFFKQHGEWSPYAPLREDGSCDFRGAMVVANDGAIYKPEDIAYPDGARYGDAICAGHDKASLTRMYRVGKARAGRLLDGREWSETPWGGPGI